jgi:hypothetical protein
LVTAPPTRQWAYRPLAPIGRCADPKRCGISSTDIPTLSTIVYASGQLPYAATVPPVAVPFTVIVLISYHGLPSQRSRVSLTIGSSVALPPPTVRATRLPMLFDETNAAFGWKRGPSAAWSL